MSGTVTVTTDAPEHPEAGTGLRGERMPHLPGLDGLRGLAVIGVLLFHGGFVWAKGGFLGVSTFFTLSGFLITNLLVREFDASHTIALGRFWTRRFRRLLPAALVAIGLVGLVWWRIGTPEQLSGLRADMIGALAYLANWRFYFSGTSYADLFSAPSPLQHFWSLAIEEQFYLFFPPIVWGVMKVGGRRLLTWLLVAAVALSIGLELWLGDNVDRVYYGTDTRAAELVLGCLLAVWWSGRRPHAAGRHAASSDGRTLTAVADVVGVVALVAMLATWSLLEETSTALSHGGFPLYAVGTTAIIYAATRPGLVARALSVPFLRWAGLISYGLYLYHWPVFLFLDEERIDLSTAPLFVVRMLVTTTLAVVSFFVLEQPIRRGTMIKTHRQLIVAGLGGAALVAAIAWAVTLDPPQSQVPFSDVDIEDFAATVDEVPISTDPSVVTTPPPPATAQTVLILGDSGMVDATPAVTAAFQAAGATKVVGGAFPGTGLTNPRLDWRTSYAQLIAEHDPDLVVMGMGGWDIEYLEENGPEAYAAIVDEAVRILTADGAHLLWLSMLPGGTTPDRTVDEVYQQLPARFPGVVAFAEIEASLRASPGATDLDTIEGSEEWPRSYVDGSGATVLLRKPDYWHLCPMGAERLAIAINQAAVIETWATLATDGWQSGPWRNHEYYDDPAGACPIR